MTMIFRLKMWWVYCWQKDDCQPTVDDIDRATADLPLMHSQLHHPEAAVTTDVWFCCSVNWVKITAFSICFCCVAYLAYLSVCPVLSVMLVYCGQTVGRMKMKLGMQVSLGPGHTVLDGDPTPLPQRGTAPRIFSTYLLWPNGWMD